MASYKIKGNQSLTGEIRVLGAKNAALKILAAAILSPDTCTVINVPQLEDIKRMIEILESLGAKCSSDDRTLTINTAAISNSALNRELVGKLRSSIMLAGPLLARFGEVTMSHPGGCVIGQRPIDLFLSGFRALGAEVIDTENYFTLKARELRGAKIVLPQVSVTVTESLMMTACLATGVTRIINAAREPEIPALAEYLNRRGAKISGAGGSEIIIEGVKKLSAGTYELMPDRIEAGSFIIMGLATGSELTIAGCRPEHLEVVLTQLQNCGARLEIGADYVITRPSRLQAGNLQTREYPGFPTDLQAPFTVLMTQARGQSLIHETIFDGRLFYTDKLKSMGANIVMCDPHRVIVNGPTNLRGKTLESPDLRAGMALVIAGLVAAGETVINNIYQIDRGYENLAGRLRALGAKIEKTDENI